MKVKKNCRVRLHYRMALANGDIVDATEASVPLELVCGRGQLIPGLERELMGMETGMKKNFVVAPDDAYGPHVASLVRQLPRASFPGDVELTRGQRFSYRSDQGTELIQVCDVTDETIVADFNHPLAGKPLHCSVEIVDVQEDSPDWNG